MPWIAKTIINLTCKDVGGGKVSYKCRFSIQRLNISEHKKGGVYQRALPYATIFVIFFLRKEVRIMLKTSWGKARPSSVQT